MVLPVFLNGGTSSYTLELKRELVLKQLGQFLHKEVLTPVFYADKVWTDEYVLAGEQIIQRPNQNNGHPLLQQTYMNGQLLLCGTETAKSYGGYTEGPVISTLSVA